MLLTRIGVLFVASLVVAACHAPSRVAVKDGSAQYVNGTEDVTLDTETSAPVTLHYSLRTEAGGCTIEVIAPGGSVAVSRSESSPPSGKIELPGITGRWIARLRFTGFRGAYVVRLEQGG